MSNRVAIVGVGRMGANMALRLQETGYQVTAVFDVRHESAEALAEKLGCIAATRLSEVTAAADIILTVVTDDKAMEKIFTTRKGQGLLTDAKGKVFINCATVSPSVHVEVQKRAKKAGAASLEACMASSISQARAGTLYLMIGGDEAVFKKVKGLLEKLSDEGKLLRYIGKAGSAAQVKALVNMVMNINTAALAEGLGLAKSLNLDLTTLMEVFSQTGAASRVLQTDGEDMVNRDHACYFSAAHAAKDSGIALSLARKSRLNLPLAKATYEQYKKLTDLGFGELDKSGIAELTFPGRGKKPASKAKKPTVKSPAKKTAKSASKRA